MKIYEILDSEMKQAVGVLQYYEKEQTYIIELQEYLDEWSAPLLFTSYVNGKKTDVVTDQNRGKRKSVFKGGCAEK